MIVLCFFGGFLVAWLFMWFGLLFGLRFVVLVLGVCVGGWLGVCWLLVCVSLCGLIVNSVVVWYFFMFVMCLLF